jgi:putative acyl-CoA dehydrogenase
MVAATRLDCVLGSASADAAGRCLRGGVARRAPLGVRGPAADKPLMQNVVADLAVESEAATGRRVRLAAAVDDLADPHEAALRRIALPLAKFWVCKRTPFMVAEALECLGGNGYVEESVLPLLYREAPLNSVWEGSGNVNALDVLRALSREPEVLEAWITEVGLARGADARLDRAVDATLVLLGDASTLEGSARRLAGQMAACLQGSLLVRFAPPEVADAFCASRLGSSYDGTFGTLDTGSLTAIVERRRLCCEAGQIHRPGGETHAYGMKFHAISVSFSTSGPGSDAFRV